MSPERNLIHHQGSQLRTSPLRWGKNPVGREFSLTFKPHLQYTKTRCLKALTLLKVTAARGLGADRDAKLMLYRALVRSKLDYGSIVYSSTRPSYLKTLDTIQSGSTHCLERIPHYTSPAASLRVEANERRTTSRLSQIIPNGLLLL